MASDLNLCCFIGRLGKEPEVRYMKSGDAVTSFSLAVGSQWKDKSGEKQESTEWVNCSVFGKLAEIAGEYLSKGSQVHVIGRLKTDKYQAQDGSDRYSTKIIVDRMQMLGGKQKDGDSKGSAPAHSAAPSAQGQPGGFEDDDDLIPF